MKYIYLKTKVILEDEVADFYKAFRDSDDFQKLLNENITNAVNLEYKRRGDKNDLISDSNTCNI